MDVIGFSLSVNLFGIFFMPGQKIFSNILRREKRLGVKAKIFALKDTGQQLMQSGQEVLEQGKGLGDAVQGLFKKKEKEEE